jgi:hypothetical protein
MAKKAINLRANAALLYIKYFSSKIPALFLRPSISPSNVLPFRSPDKAEPLRLEAEPPDVRGHDPQSYRVAIDMID